MHIIGRDTTHEMIRLGTRELRAATLQLYSAGPRLIHGATHRELKRALLEGFVLEEKQLGQLEGIGEVFLPAPTDFSDVVGGWLAELWASRTREWIPEERDASTAIALKHILSYLDEVYLSTIELCRLSGRTEIAARLGGCAREIHAAHAPLTAVLADLLTHRRHDRSDPDRTPINGTPLLARAVRPTVGELVTAGRTEVPSGSTAGW